VNGRLPDCYHGNGRSANKKTGGFRHRFSVSGV